MARESVSDKKGGIRMKKKTYEKPKVVYEGTLEVLAGVCSDMTGDIGTCKTTGSCVCIEGS